MMGTHTRTLTRLAAVTSVTTALTLVSFVAAATAAVPSNDNYADRQAVTVGSSTAFDNTDATVEPIDQEALGTCTPPAVDKTVWFDVTTGPTVTDELNLEVSSSFGAGIAVVTGDPGAFTQLACVPTSTLVSVAPNSTYHVMVWDAYGTGGGAGTLTVSEVVPPTMTATLDPKATVDRAGNVTVSGTVRCTGASYVSISGTVTQTFGRLKISGGFSATPAVTCDGTSQRWSAVATSSTYRFAGGKATVELSSFACGTICTSGEASRTVLVTGKR